MDFVRAQVNHVARPRHDRPAVENKLQRAFEHDRKLFVGVLVNGKHAPGREHHARDRHHLAAHEATQHAAAVLARQRRFGHLAPRSTLHALSLTKATPRCQFRGARKKRAANDADWTEGESQRRLATPLLRNFTATHADPASGA